MNSRTLAICLVALAAVASCASWLWLDSRNRRHKLDEARQDLKAGRTARALERLAGLAARWPGWGEVEYHLGLVEQARGRMAAANVAWSRALDDPQWGGKAAAALGRSLINQGKFTAAEDVLRKALDSCKALGSPDTPLVRAELELLYQFEGRTSEARRLIVESWRDTSDPAAVLKKLYLVDKLPYPIAAVRAILARADQEDDRVWLGEANLAIREGRLSDATRWLDRCRARDRVDSPVWRAVLEMALAGGDEHRVREAMEHLPGASYSDQEVGELEAWLAARLNNRDAEHLVLTQRLTREPSRIGTLEKLAELEARDGNLATAEQFRQRKDEINRLRLRYGDLLERPDPRANASEFADLALKLGRLEEARGWAWIRDRQGAGLGGPRESISAESLDAPGTAEDSLAARLQRTLGPGSLAAHPQAAAGETHPRAIAIPRFSEGAEEVGLRFLHDNGKRPGKPMFPTLSNGGVGVLDYDGDGWMDVYCVQGGDFPPRNEHHDGDRLFRNKGDGHFLDVTGSAGIAKLAQGYGHGIAVGDYDNDGHPDIFVTRWRRYALYRNRGDGTFEDATDRAGLGGDRDWPTSAVFADLDDDGDLDLYVCHYLAFDVEAPNLCAQGDREGTFECSPRDYRSLPDHIFRNDGGRFVDVSNESGITAADQDGRGLGVLAADLDGDRRTDLFVANDTTANFLFKNRGGFRFEESALSAGVAANANGGFQAGMGVACGDLDGDGLVDLAVTNFFGESTTFFRSLGRGMFVDATASVGLAAPSRYLLGFGVAFLDANNDGMLDLVTANGHINDRRPQYPWSMPAQILLGRGGGMLIDASSQAGPPFQATHLGRGLATTDLDNDGRVDLILLAQNEPLIYLRNEGAANSTNMPAHFLTIKLEGSRSNRDGIGAIVSLRANGRTRVAQNVGGGSFQSARDPRLHFGLGGARLVDELEVAWPSGRIDRYRELESDRGYLVRESNGSLEPLIGFRESNPGE